MSMRFVSVLLIPKSTVGGTKGPRWKLHVLLSLCVTAEEPVLSGTRCFITSSKWDCSLSQRETLPHPSRLLAANSTRRNAPDKEHSWHTHTPTPSKMCRSTRNMWMSVSQQPRHVPKCRWWSSWVSWPQYLHRNPHYTHGMDYKSSRLLTGEKLWNTHTHTHNLMA